jgi:two-component system KDP operon response regulator KdpE
VSEVLVADPDRPTRRLLMAALRFAGHSVEVARTPAQATSLLRRRRFDAVIVDPSDSGPVETVAALRAQTDIPIIVVSTAAAEWDKVTVLDAGADDYVTKPIGTEELLARLRVLLRRVPRAEDEEKPVTTADFTVHLADRRWIQRDGTEVNLTPLEWKLIDVLVRRAGHLVTQADLLQSVWGPKARDKTQYLRVQIAAIRRKVEPEPSRPRYFITAPGLGLRFDPGAGDRLQPC